MGAPESHDWGGRLVCEVPGVDRRGPCDHVCPNSVKSKDLPSCSHGSFSFMHAVKRQALLCWLETRGALIRGSCERPEVQFALRFVERFKDVGGFFDGAFEDDVASLVHAQHKASSHDLQQELGVPRSAEPLVVRPCAV